MKVFIGMECSGVIRRAMTARGHEVVSADFKPAEDETNHHFEGDVFSILERLMITGWVPDLGIFHPTCTYLTYAAEWAFSNGPYHQKLKAGTLTGAGRWAERMKAVEQCEKILSLPIDKIALENPKGYLTKAIRKPDQIVQPYQFGDDASKATCLWLKNLPSLKPTNFFPPRLVNGKPRWSNQTDSGQSRLGPGENRATDRSRTYSGIANAITVQWGLI